MVFITTHTAQEVRFSIKDFFTTCDQIRSFLRIWSYLLKKPLMENFHFLCSDNQLKVNDKLVGEWQEYLTTGYSYLGIHLFGVFKSF